MIICGNKDKLSSYELLWICILGSFFPEEDNRFMERVKAAVEEEERQSAAAADTSSTVAAIANAEEAGKAAYTHTLQPKIPDIDSEHGEESKPLVKDHTNLQYIPSETQKPDIETEQSGQSKSLAKNQNMPFLNVENSNVNHKSFPRVGATNASLGGGALPAEFYHYYYGSSVDMGALIEVFLCADVSSNGQILPRLISHLSSGNRVGLEF